MPSEIIASNKLTNETLADLRHLFKSYGIEDHEAVPMDGNAYAVRYHNGQAWVTIESRIQPTRAKNLRQCFQVIDSLLRWQIRGISGLAGGQAFISGLPVRVDSFGNKASEFVEACGILGVDPEASWDAIYDVYRVKAKRAHPDAGGDAERFKRLNKALETIKKVKEK